MSTVVAALTEIRDKSITRLPDGPKHVSSYHCNGCDKLKNLAGAPEQVDVFFDAANCTSLVSLEGAPTKMHLGSRGGRFSVENCTNLESLEHCPPDLDILNVQGCKKLKTLKGGPTVANGFWLAQSGITSLEGCPDTLQHLDVSYCKELKDLTGCTRELNSLKAHNSGLVTLAGAPAVNNGDSDFSECEELVSLQGLPEHLRGSLYLGGCKKLTSLVGAPKTVMGFVRLTGTGITSLKGIGTDYFTTVVQELGLQEVKITSHALGLLLIKGLKTLHADFPGAKIIKSYINTRKLRNGSPHPDELIDCQHELIEAGFEDIAQL